MRRLTDSALVDPGTSASRVLANKELLEECLRRLPVAERQLADPRALGRTREEVAADVEKNPIRCAFVSNAPWVAWHTS